MPGKSTTLSFTTPIELSIQMDVYMELNGLNRSQFIKMAVMFFLDKQKQESNMPDVLNEIQKEIKLIKIAIEKK